MKKRLNYFQAHKNKRGRNMNKKRKGYINLIALRAALISMSSVIDINKINSCVMSASLKSVQMANICIKNAIAVQEIAKNERFRKFKITGKY